MSDPTTVITAEQLAAIDALPCTLFSHTSAATQQLLLARLTDFPSSEPLSYALSEISIQRQCRVLDDAAATAIMSAALADAGYGPLAGVIKHDLLRLMDHVTETQDYDLRDKRCLFGAAVAVALGELDVAHNFLDGPAGAGIGWDLTRQEIERQLGMPLRDLTAE
jgi:hypothetical protein